jgi:hypothetical protein
MTDATCKVDKGILGWYNTGEFVGFYIHLTLSVRTPHKDKRRELWEKQKEAGW